MGSVTTANTRGISTTIGGVPRDRYPFTDGTNTASTFPFCRRNNQAYVAVLDQGGLSTATVELASNFGGGSWRRGGQLDGIQSNVMVAATTVRA
jgi:hypothetical protein